MLSATVCEGPAHLKTTPAHLQLLLTQGSQRLKSTAASEPPSGKRPTQTTGTTGHGTGKGKDGGHLTCPKCGDPCTQVETFVCE